jgi:flagellar hook-basal body complex protein FliE
MAVEFDSPSTLRLPPTARVAPSASGAAGAGQGFGAALESMLRSVDQTAGDANTALASMVDGTGEVHDAMIALQRAEQTLQLTIQTRNKLLQAYQEIMRMPV